MAHKGGMVAIKILLYKTREHKCLVVPMPITLLLPHGDGANGEMHTENFKIEFFLLYFNIKWK